MTDPLEWLQQAATTRVLIRLLDGPRYISELIRGVRYPEGIASQQSIAAARILLKLMGLIEEYDGEETPRPRLYLRLTEKGRKVAELLRSIEEVIQSP